MSIRLLKCEDQEHPLCLYIYMIPLWSETIGNNPLNNRAM